MEIKVDNIFGPFDYVVIGDKAEDAAAEFKNELDRLSRLPGSVYFLDSLESIEKRISEKYDVEIKTTLQ